MIRRLNLDVHIDDDKFLVKYLKERLTGVKVVFVETDSYWLDDLDKK